MKVTDDFVLFWNGSFSNWATTPFSCKGMRFNCGEQYMMYQKAKLFGDSQIARMVMESKSPKIQKQLGRQVERFDADKWYKVCVNLMVEGLLCKFQQNPECKNKLLATGNREIVEASPYDTIWGIGLAEDNPDALIKGQWKGQNLLGVVLMKVRAILQKEENQSGDSAIG